MESKIFILKNKKEEAPDVFTLEFIPAEEKVFSFKSGQFALFQILKEEFSDIRGKAYTIISLPGEDVLTITVKGIGELSNALCGLNIGDKVKVMGPYGSFYPGGSATKDIVFLAGGIGVTPFYAVIKDFYKKEENRKITLFYSNRKKDDIVFLKDLKEISEKWKNLEIIYILTREKEKIPYVKEYERININAIKKYLGDLDEKDYFICGPSSFVTDIKEQLKNAGIRREYIKTEAFY